MRLDDVVELHAQTWVVSIDLPVTEGLRLHNRSRPGRPDPRRVGLGGWTPTPYHSLDPRSGVVRSGRGARHRQVGVLPGGRSAPIASQPGELLTSAGSGSIWFVFDGDGLHLRSVDGRSGAVLWRFEHGPDGRLERIVDRDGLVVLRSRRQDDAVDLVGPGPLGVRIELDPRGWSTSIRATDDTTVATAFDAEGCLVEVVDAAGRSRRASFDRDLRLSSVDRPAGPSFSLVRHRDGTRTTLTKIGADGREARHVTERSADGTVRRTSWCCGGEQPTVRERRDGTSVLTRADGTVVRRRTTRTADRTEVRRTVELPSGLLTEHAVITTGDPTAGRFTTTTEINGRSYTSETRPDGTVALVGPDGARTTWTVDEVGRPLALDAPGGTFTMRWDDQGRIVAASDGHGTLTAGYDTHGRLDHLVAGGIETWLEHDAHGRVVAQRWGDGRRVELTYGPAGALVEVRPPDRPATRFDHVDRGVLASITLPEVDDEVAVQRFERDQNGSLTALHRADGARLHIQRDARGWVRALTGPDVEIFHERAAGDGRLLALRTSEGVTTRFRWDGDRQTAVEVDGPAPSSITCRWDADRRPVELHVAGAEPVRRAWDAAGRPVAVGPLSIERDPGSGRVTSRRLGRVAEIRAVDAGRLVNRWIVCDGEEVVAEQRSHDEHGRLSQVTTRVRGEVTTETYLRDDTGRLVGYERDGRRTTWQYDTNGNRVATVGPAGAELLEVDARDRLTRWGERRVAHLPDGEMAGWSGPTGSTSLHHDVFGRLHQLTLSDGVVVRHRHDGRGVRVATEVGTDVVGRWSWWQPGIPAAELDAEGRVLRSFVGDGSPRSFEYLVDGDHTLLVVTDGQGSPRWFVDASTGELALDLPRDPWGEPLGAAPPAGPFGFLAGMTDGITPLVTIGARHLVAGLGRWTTPDPLLYRGGDTNWYAYALGDPVEHTDPTGTKVELCSAPSAGALGAIGGEHVWIRTGSVEAGMGSHPFESTLVPLSDRVVVKDHTGEGASRDGASCEEVPDADEECVNAQLQTPNDVGDSDPRGAGIRYGEDLGMWGPTNTCQQFAETVLRNCGSQYADDAFDPGSTAPSDTAAYDGGMSEAPPENPPLDHTPDPGYTPADQQAQDGSTASLGEDAAADTSGDGSLWE